MILGNNITLPVPEHKGEYGPTKSTRSTLFYCVDLNQVNLLYSLNIYLSVVKNSVQTPVLQRVMMEHIQSLTNDFLYF